MTSDFDLSAYRYELPQELIAQEPSEKREEARLLVLDRTSGKIAHRRFKDVVEYLVPGDCLVINRTKVFPARLKGRKPTGGKIEFLLLEFPVETGAGEATATALCRSSKPVRPGLCVEIAESMEAEVVKKHASGQVSLLLRYEGELLPVLENTGQMPLPPYIKREGQEDMDRQRYQTVYAEEVGSVAAPTAGLHFTPELMEALAHKGVKIAPVVLHVGYGTFSPIRTQDIRQHRIHSEWITIHEESAATIRSAKAEGGRIVAVGTTSVRTLEFVCKTTGRIQAFSGLCDLYIYPGFDFRVTDVLITNFHLPGSSLLVLVSAFAGRKRILDAYEEAVRKRYRFFSYGDAMLIV